MKNLDQLAHLMGGSIHRLNELKVKYTYACPECGEKLTESEAEQVCDEGCPSCRTLFDVEDYKLD